MTISIQTADNFVKEIGSYLNHKLVITSDTGTILASSETFNTGTKSGIACSLLENIARDKNASLELETDEGIAFALKSNKNSNDIFGILVIKGDAKSIKADEKSISFVKNMTTILIADKAENEDNELSERIKCRFIHKWLYGDNKNINSKMIEYGASLGIDITLPRRFFAFSAVMKDDLDTPEKQQIYIDKALQEACELVQNERGGIALISGSIVMCGIYEKKDEEILAFINTIKKSVEEKYPLYLAVGIDTGSTGYVHAHEECLKAEKAVLISARSPTKSPRFYDSINMEIFSGELSDKVKEEYIRHIFKNCPTYEIRDWLYLLNIYFQNEGSITNAANALGMPKNTLQYKLRKLKNKTGYDPRSIRFSGLFYNAIHFYSDLGYRR